MLDLSPYRQEFPALQMEIEGRRHVFFDNPGGTQVPQAVVEAMSLVRLLILPSRWS